MEDVLLSKGLYWITLGKEATPIDASNKSKWDRKNDEAHGLFRMSISSYLQFHLQGVHKSDDAWKNLEIIFGKHDTIRSH